MTSLGRAKHPIILGAVTAAAVILSACGSGPPAAASGVTEYVGKITGTEYFIALAVGPSGDVEAYLCDGRRGAAQLNGRVENGRLALQPGGAWNNPGARSAATDLDGTVSDAAVDGTVAMDGQRRSFRAGEATGPGGLYTFTVANDGSRLTGTGTSERGNKLDGTVQNGQTSATFTPPDGDPQPLQPGQLPPSGGPTSEVFTGYRVVMLDTFETRGKNLPNASKSGSGDTSFTSRELDL